MRVKERINDTSVGKFGTRIQIIIALLLLLLYLSISSHLYFIIKLHVYIPMYIELDEISLFLVLSLFSTFSMFYIFNILRNVSFDCFFFLSCEWFFFIQYLNTWLLYVLTKMIVDVYTSSQSIKIQHISSDFFLFNVPLCLLFHSIEFFILVSAFFRPIYICQSPLPF